MHNPPVCIDGRMLAAGTGVTTYARALRAALPLIAAERRLLVDAAPGAAAHRSRLARLALALPRHAREARPLDGDATGERLLVAPDIFRRAQVHFGIHRRLLTVTTPGPPGIMHWTYPVPLRMAGWRNVYTVHDAIPLTHPELTPIEPRRHRRLLDRIVADAAGIVTVSAAARAAIVAALGCADAFVTDCGQAADVAPPPPAAPLPAGLARGRYLIVCGTVEPRKNIDRIVAAHAAAGTALPLVIAGPDGWRARDLDRMPGLLRLRGLDRGAMLALIAGARALLMPSLAEGFGLPVAEAMALGTPVLTSADGALAETAGGAALLVDPLDTAAIAAGIARLATDDALCAKLAAAGRARAAGFALPAFAARLAALYGALIAGARRSG